MEKDTPQWAEWAFVAMLVIAIVGASIRIHQIGFEAYLHEFAQTWQEIMEESHKCPKENPDCFML